MKNYLAFLAVAVAATVFCVPALGDEKSSYPPAEKRTPSPGHTTYYVHPAKGRIRTPG